MEQKSDGSPAGRIPPHLHLLEAFDLPDGVHAAAADDAEGTYLVVELVGPRATLWVCAPASVRALQCVKGGQTDAWNVAHHSATGTVELWRRSTGGTLSESVLLCAQLPAPEELVAA